MEGDKDKQHQQQPTTTTATATKDVDTEYVPFFTNNNIINNKVVFPGVNGAIPDGADPVAWGIIPPPPPPPPCSAPYDALQGSGQMQYRQQQKYHHQYYNYQGQPNQYQPSSGYDVAHHHYNRYQ
jgi:hypothetical protein